MDRRTAAIDRLSPQGGTSVSEGLFRSLGAITGRPLQIDEGAPVFDVKHSNLHPLFAGK